MMVAESWGFGCEDGRLVVWVGGWLIINELDGIVVRVPRGDLQNWNF